MSSKNFNSNFSSHFFNKNNFYFNDWYDVSLFFKNKKNNNFKYHWDDLKKKKKDFKYLSKVNEKILKNLAQKLNKLHNLNYNLNYWRVILGPWLYIFISSSFDRWEILTELIKKKKKLNYTSYLTEKIINLDYRDYLNKVINSDTYNYKIFDRIIKFRFKKKVKIKFIQNKEILVNVPQNIFAQKINYLIFIIQKNYFKLLCKNKKNIFFTFFFKKKKIFPFLNKIKNCNFLIFFIFTNFIRKQDFNYNLRIKNNFTFKANNSFEEYLKVELFNEIPITYLEKFKYLRSSLLEKNKNKLNIISTVEHLEDDVIKIWIAEKIFNNSILHIYDHSNSMRLSMYDFNHEKKISERIISCLKYKDKKFINLPDLKFSLTSDQKNSELKKNFGSIILYEGSKYAGKLSSAPFGPTNNIQFEQIIKFYSNLKGDIRKKFKFKPPPYSNFRINTKKKVKILFGKEKVLDETMSLENIISQSKLIICTYPQTTFLEIILSKKPFIIIYPKNLWEFDKNSQRVLNKLKKKNILFHDELKASNYVNKKWDNIESWWNSKEIQKTLNDVVNNDFSLKSHNKEWKNYFKKYLR